MSRTPWTGCVAIFSLWLAPQAVLAECKLTQYASAEIAVGPSGALLVPVQVGGRDVWMVLQMSSGMAMIWPAAVEQLGLKSRRVRQDNLFANGIPIEREVEVQSIRIGGANFADWTLQVQPGPQQPMSQLLGKPVIGTVSARFMNVVDVEIDLAGRRMNLFKQTTCRGEAVYWSREYTAVKLFQDRSGLLYFPMELDGNYVETSLNTLGPRARFSEVIAKKYFRFDRNSPGVQRLPVGGGVLPLVGMRRMALTAKEISMPDVPVFLYDDTGRKCEPAKSERDSAAIGFSNCFSTVPFEIGTDLLKQLRIYIASKEERIYFTRAASTVPGPAGRPGPGPGDASVPRSAGPADPVPAASDPAVPPPAAAPAESAAAANPGDAAGGAAPTR